MDGVQPSFYVSDTTHHTRADLAGGQATGKVAIITAGGSGMGAAATRALAADGFHVAVLSSSG
jgi:NADP-dependent 3-hydroxy acid dehydrogenase YdfG